MDIRRFGRFCCSAFRALTEDQITEAHAYAYGGSVIQDLGYYPFGSKEFSDLVHYVRSGDFVCELLRQSQDANEYAFALGALSHYTADMDGHPAVNEAVALRYPKLRAKYGNSVRYAQDTTAHLKVEFGFDTLQVARNRYASDQYHDFIGFRVAQPLLERTFLVVYGLQLKDVLTHEDLAIGSYRFSVSRVIPQMTKVALQMHKKDLMRETPNFARRKFLYRLSRSDYEREWGKTYTKPGFGTRSAVGSSEIYSRRSAPSKAWASITPRRRRKICISRASMPPSINTASISGRCELARWFCPTAIWMMANQPKWMNTRWPMTTYASLLGKLEGRKFEGTSRELRDNIVGFYSGDSTSIESRNDPAHAQDILKDLVELKSMAPPPLADPSTP